MKRLLITGFAPEKRGTEVIKAFADVFKDSNAQIEVLCAIDDKPIWKKLGLKTKAVSSINATDEILKVLSRKAYDIVCLANNMPDLPAQAGEFVDGRVLRLITTTENFIVRMWTYSIDQLLDNKPLSKVDSSSIYSLLTFKLSSELGKLCDLRMLFSDLEAYYYPYVVHAYLLSSTPIEEIIIKKTKEIISQNLTDKTKLPQVNDLLINTNIEVIRPRYSPREINPERNYVFPEGWE